jgi:hypothetical protein
MSDLNHSNFYQEIKRIVKQARSQTYKAINFTMVQAYWHIYLIFPIPHALLGKSEIDIRKTGIRPELSWTHYRLL